MTRSEIKDYLNNSFEKTNYAQSIRKSKSVENITIADLDFIDILRDLYYKIIGNMNIFESNNMWTISNRQKHLIEEISNICNNISHIEKLKLIHIHMYDDLYWQIYDYFDDYGNKNENICKEEIGLIVDFFEMLFDGE